MKNAGKACNNRLYRHIRTFKKIIKNYFVISGTYEYYLHRILGDTMGLATEKENGTNNFSYFLRNNIGKYECNSPKTALLTLQQQDYLNDLYTKYNSVRHPYSHWSAEDVETAVIPDIQTARQLLLEGIEIIDRYYTVF